MKTMILIVAMLVAIPTLNAQKKEIKNAEKEVRAGNLESAASYLDQAKRIFAAADGKTRAEYYVVEAEMRFAQKNLDAKQIALISESINLANRYELTSSLQGRISQIQSQIKGSTATIAAGEFTNKNYSNAANLYKTAFQASGDHDHLLKAARSYLLAKEYDGAFDSYKILYNLGDTQAKTQYVATDKESKKKVAFASKSERDEAVAEGSYKTPETITTHSKLPEILRGITVAAMALDKKYEAVALIDKAIAKMPGNKMLLNQASHFYKQLGAYKTYYAVLDQLIKDAPNDPNLYYNSAVASAENNDVERAKQYYKKALKVDPNYTNANVNLALLLLEEDKGISDEMNQLGVSEADDTRYEKLKQKRINLYYVVLPYVQSIVKSQPQNEDFAKKLKQMNSFIGINSTIAIERNIDD